MPKGSAWERRNAAAKAKGYRNYYDYRIHDYGKRPPTEPVQSGQRQRKSGGKGAAALRRALKKPDQIALIVEAPLDRGPDGEWKRVAYATITVDGDMPHYYITLTDEYDMDYWHGLIDDSGVDFLEYGAAAAAIAGAA